MSLSQASSVYLMIEKGFFQEKGWEPLFYNVESNTKRKATLTENLANHGCIAFSSSLFDSAGGEMFISSSMILLLT